jgi:hypothetical protein
MLKLVALVALSLSSPTMEDIMDHVRALEEKVQKDHEEISALKDQLMPAGALLTFVDGRTVCPKGTTEANITQGMVLVGRPKNGKTGAVFNRPFDAGEIGRGVTHSHDVSVKDPGHTHVGIVNDPGHTHNITYTHFHGGDGRVMYPYAMGPNQEHYPTQQAKTGITVDNLPAKSSIEVSIDANDAGEHYPLVYVLLCQKLP